MKHHAYYVQMAENKDKEILEIIKEGTEKK